MAKFCVRFFYTTTLRGRAQQNTNRLDYSFCLPVFHAQDGIPSGELHFFCACFNTYLAEDRWATKNILQSAALSAIVVTLFFLIFHYLLAVPLPTGSWFEYAD